MYEIELRELPPEHYRQSVTNLENFMRELPQVETKPVHRFAKGLYCRELFMPKDTVFVSMVHKHESVAIVSKGDISICQESGVFRMTAPCTMTTSAGTKRIGLTHEDTIFITVHALPEGMDENTPIEDIEAYIACDTLDDYDMQMIEELKKLEEV